jgi:glycine dehydrogenase
VLQTRSTPIEIVELVVGNHQEFDFSKKYFGAILQYPRENMVRVYDYADFIKRQRQIVK